MSFDSLPGGCKARQSVVDGKEDVSVQAGTERGDSARDDEQHYERKE